MAFYLWYNTMRRHFCQVCRDLIGAVYSRLLLDSHPGFIVAISLCGGMPLMQERHVSLVESRSASPDRAGLYPANRKSPQVTLPLSTIKNRHPRGVADSLSLPEFLFRRIPCLLHAYMLALKTTELHCRYFTRWIMMVHVGSTAHISFEVRIH